MGFGALAVGLLLSATLVACGGSKDTGKQDGGTTLGDAFITTGCDTVTDCSPNACQTAKCNVATKMCQYTDKMCASDTTCPAETVCSKSVCNIADGTWTSTGQNDGMACTTSSNEPGACSASAAACAAIPTCYSANSYNSVDCGSDDYSLTTGSNDPSGFSGAAASVSSYACAPNEAGPELGYKLYLGSATTGNVTITLKLTDANGAVLADQTGIDLDLIILQDTCAGNSACSNPTTGTGFQGITTGTSDERVTFPSDPAKTYYAVVDSKAMNQVGNFAIEVESCGQCAAKTTSQIISCNMTMPVQASTSTGTHVLTNYTCADSTSPVLAGNEIPFLFKDTSGTGRTVNASLTGATQPATLLALSQDSYGGCDPTGCLASSATSNGSATVSFTTASSSYSFSRNWVIVDTPNATDSSFGLELDCPAFCSYTDYATCIGTDSSGGFPSGFGSTASGHGYASSTQYGPAGTPCGGLTGLTGPENAIKFTPTITAQETYQVNVTSSTVGVNQSFVVVDAGTTTTTCAPTDVCAQNLTPVAGTGLSGTLTTVGSTSSAAATFLGQPGHVYYIIVDSTNPAGGDFSIIMSGKTAGAGCGL
ncbi:MAG: hypothetical protein ABI321_02210 [Polyangia bacterium]